MKKVNCEVCGSNVEVMGKTTHYYNNLDTERIAKLEADNKKLLECVAVIALAEINEGDA